VDFDLKFTEARDPATPFQCLMALTKHPEVEVRHALLDNPNVLPTDEDGKLTTSLLEALAREFPEEVTVHPTFVLHALIEPAKEMGEVVVHVVGRTTDVGLIEHVFRTWRLDDWRVRRAMAQNPNTPPDTLRLLSNEATESNGYVRRAVARNPNTPVDTLRLLGNRGTESSWYVRQAVAENPTTPEDTLRSLGNEVTESVGDVRVAVARNPNTPQDTLRILGNRGTESEWYVRRAVASNPNTPPDILRLLGNETTESVGSVREAAKKALEARGLP